MQLFLKQTPNKNHSSGLNKNTKIYLAYCYIYNYAGVCFSNII